MISAFEAKAISRENYKVIKANQFDRLVKDVERRIKEGIELGKGYITINHNLEEFDELVKYFDAFGYEMKGVRYWDGTDLPHTKYFLIWDEEKFEKEVVAEGIEKFFEREQHDTRKGKEGPFLEVE